MNTIVEMIFGSHLYGTSSPSSDHDFKGIFLPTAREIALLRVPKSVGEHSKKGEGKNTSSDYDKEFYSLHYFIDLACKGETVALDMLHAPGSALISSSFLWAELSGLRARFYTKNLRAFVGYARKQAAKYGVKGSRLAEAKKVLNFFDVQLSTTKLEHVWEDLPTGEHIHKEKNENGRLYVVCGKAMTEKAFCRHYIEMLDHFVRNYGERARQAEANEGVDWKAMSHAFRTGFQVRHICSAGGYTYPLPETEFLVRVKRGELHFANEAGPALDQLLDELEALTAASPLPSEVDREYWDNWLVNVLREYRLA